MEKKLDKTEGLEKTAKTAPTGAVVHKCELSLRDRTAIHLLGHLFGQNWTKESEYQENAERALKQADAYLKQREVTRAVGEEKSGVL